MIDRIIHVSVIWSSTKASVPRKEIMNSRWLHVLFGPFSFCHAVYFKVDV